MGAGGPPRPFGLVEAPVPPSSGARVSTLSLRNVGRSGSEVTWPRSDTGPVLDDFGLGRGVKSGPQ